MSKKSDARYRKSCTMGKPAPSRKCPKCGCKEFIGSQSVRGSLSVVVAINKDGLTTFLRNPTEDGLMDSSELDFDHPEGPFICLICKEELE